MNLNILLFIVIWLTSGFLGLYILDCSFKREFETKYHKGFSRLSYLGSSLLGCFMLFVGAIFIIINDGIPLGPFTKIADFLGKPLFKREN